MRFEVAELCELFVAAVQLTCEGLGGGVYDLVRSHVPMLRKRLAANVAVIWSLSGMPSFVGLEVA